jgi:hypothetical protein
MKWKNNCFHKVCFSNGSSCTATPRLLEHVQLYNTNDHMSSCSYVGPNPPQTRRKSTAGAVQLCNPVDTHSLKGAWFQNVNLKYDLLVSKLSV